MASFFHLPPETRNNIYGLLLADSSTSLRRLTASRLIHQEATSYFYQNSSLTLNLNSPGLPEASYSLPIPEKYLGYFRVLTANIELGYVSSRRVDLQAQRLTALACHCTSLTTLALNFVSTASKVVSGTIDDCVLDAAHPITLALQQVLSSGIKSVRVSLDGVWFAPGLVDKLMSKSRLEVITSESSTERAMHGREMRDHMRDFGLDSRDLEDAVFLQSLGNDGEFPSMPSSFGSAFLDMDQFSPTEDLDEYYDDLQESAEEEESNALADKPMFDMDDLDEGSEEELTDDDDIDDEEMQEIDDIESIVNNLQEITYQRLNEKDMCYMTNFAPNMLRA